jgi:hypothetical protein
VRAAAVRAAAEAAEAGPCASFYTSTSINVVFVDTYENTNCEKLKH